MGMLRISRLHMKTERPKVRKSEILESIYMALFGFFKLLKSIFCKIRASKLAGFPSFPEGTPSARTFGLPDLIH
jgi:hypothetical protein